MKIVSKLLKIDMSFHIFKAFKSNFDTIASSKHLCELRLMIDIAGILRVYRANEITNIGWVLSEQNVANNFIRYIDNNIFVKSRRTGRIDLVIKQ